MEQNIQGRLSAQPGRSGAATKKDNAHNNSQNRGFETELEIKENAMRVLEKRYLKKDADGNPLESAEDMFRRVCTNIAEAEKNY
ncbi:MAG: hypothetical protein GWO38_18375, partial [Phycisphaerae bacterium]|nr:hypothetical protein [Phycisphaerae bacterium]NIW98073.1 hypothetical protein [Phycisphaerae bacterium]NIX29541.1 hypothetical protein [Phycisphaerae bacterium]